LYDGGNDDWLSMKHVAGEWAVAFHGINYPNKAVPVKNMTVLQSIMSGRKQGNMLYVKPPNEGGRHAKMNNIAANKAGESVGLGIYCSPLFTTCLTEYTQ
jgi:hypothetical protein